MANMIGQTLNHVATKSRCPSCGHEIHSTLDEMKRTPQFACPSCGDDCDVREAAPGSSCTQPRPGSSASLSASVYRPISASHSSSVSTVTPSSRRLCSFEPASGRRRRSRSSSTPSPPPWRRAARPAPWPRRASCVSSVPVNTTVLPATARRRSTALERLRTSPRSSRSSSDVHVVRLGEEIGQRLGHRRRRCPRWCRAPGKRLARRCALAAPASLARKRLDASRRCRASSLRGRLADVADAEREDEAVERDRAARLDGGEQLARPTAAPQPSRSASVVVERASRAAGVKMSAGDWISPSSKNACDLLLAQPLDVEGVARHEMLQPLDRLRRADQAAGAAAHHVDLAGLGSTSRTAWLPQTGQSVGKA